MCQKPQFIIIAGPNGAGKTTTASKFLPNNKDIAFINADFIAKGLSPFDTGITPPNITAGKIAIQQIKAHMDRQESFALETTLSGLSHLKFINQAQEKGYKTTLFYVYLDAVDIAIARVKNRVENGGHNIPVDTIKRRYVKSLQNISKYASVVDEIIIINNSNLVSEIIYEKFETEKISNTAIFDTILGDKK